MKVTCPECRQEYDDTYHNTICPHNSFEMHCGVFVNGQNGCAHTVEELDKAMNGVLPNPDCEHLLMILELQKDLQDESCHFGDCG